MRGLVNYNVTEDEDNYKVIINPEGVKGNNITGSGKTIYTTEKIAVELHDPRKLELEFSRCGLAFVNHSTLMEKKLAAYPSSKRRFDDKLDKNTKEQYDQEIEKLLKTNIENIDEVVGMTHSFRSDSNPIALPVFHVHGDYTPFSAKKRMEFVLKEKVNDWLMEDVHCGIVNVWRPIGEPVEKSPLGFVDPSTLSPEDWVKILYIYPDEGKPGEFQLAEHTALVHKEKHRWLVADKMESGMVWIFNQYDSQGLGTVPHSAVKVIGTKDDARPRRSIESRMLVKYK